MNLLVDKPILNSPFKEPNKHWIYKDGQPQVVPFRRPAGYYFKIRRRNSEEQLSLFTDEQFVELDLVNNIREAVKTWRQKDYPGVTQVTRQLLLHWNDSGREKLLFFCQREAVETIIWLTEIHSKQSRGINIPLDVPIDEYSLSQGYKALKRYGIKMATGSGKTVVMAMIAAWSILNKVFYPKDVRFSDAILVVCPNLTVKERLGGAPSKQNNGDAERALIPGAKGNYYDKFDLVPNAFKEALGHGKFLITNWHVFSIYDDSNKKGVEKKGKESDRAFVNRVLKQLGNKKNILVLNDEAHHAYRPAPFDENNERYKGLSAEEKNQIKTEKEEATVWVGGLDRINKVRGINFCVDLSATPFYIQGSGYEEGMPFPWLVSDFGLVDAIECGIVKIPRMPVEDDTGALIPKYFNLWKWINDRLPAQEKATARRKPKPEAVVREAEGALQTLAGEWQKKFEEMQKENFKIPPVLIAVCDNTKIAERLYEFIAFEGNVLPDYFKNSPEKENTLRIDTKLLEKAEFADEGQSKQEAAEQLRQKVATVGKEGEPGEQIRCVVSVGMLTEGWDAQNVTQILGLRAFTSQLLCEQVVGRGLRRLNYNFDLDEKGIPQNEEYVDVYGIPFEVIPVKKKTSKSGTPLKESTLVKALPEREHLKIEFPRVEGYVFKVKSKIKANIDELASLTIEPRKEPTETIVRAQVGFQLGSPAGPGPGKTVRQNREKFYQSIRLQEIIFEIARRITGILVGDFGHEAPKFKYNSRQILFPQVLSLVKEYVSKKIEFNGVDKREIGLEKYVQQIVERLVTAIYPDETEGEVPLLPKIERFRPRGSTNDVLFRTIKPCKGTVKSHVSHVVLDSKTWESSAAFYLEKSHLVVSYVKNDHLDFVIPYVYSGITHNYRPDFLVKLKNGITLILEIKGYEDEEARVKKDAALRWVKAVNNWGQMGKWAYAVCKNPQKLSEILRSLI